MTAPLPADLIEQVLLRLPARSLLKFRSACKLFNHLTTAPNFVSAHIQRSRDLVPNSLAMLETPIPPQDDIHILHGGTGLTTKCELIKKLDILSLQHEYNQLLAACDGLICLSKVQENEKFSIVNLLMRKCFSGLLCVNGETSIVGFYYNVPSGEYRLLLHNYDSNEVGSYLVCTVGRDELRMVDWVSTVYEPTNYSTLGSVVIQGKLYFVGSRYDTSLKKGMDRMVVFDTKTEQFTLLPLPQNMFSYGHKIEMKLLDIEGKLCVYTVVKERNPCECDFEVRMWVLVDSVKGIWIEKMLVHTTIFEGLEGDYIAVGYSPCFHMFLLVKLGDIDFASPDKSFTFYCLPDEYRHFGRRYYPFNYATRYTETLASVEDEQ